MFWAKTIFPIMYGKIIGDHQYVLCENIYSVHVFMLHKCHNQWFLWVRRGNHLIMSLVTIPSSCQWVS